MVIDDSSRISASANKIRSLLSSIKREGIEILMNYLETSSFYTDPASCQDHNSYEGGLAEHSLNVYLNLLSLEPVYPELEKLEDTLKIVGLLHDLSLVGTFQKVSKNVPLKGADGKNKKNESGKIIFIEQESYDSFPEAQMPYPSGQLSAMIIKRFIKLTKLEDLAIQWHRGIYDTSQNTLPLLKRAQKTHKLVLLTHMADQEASLYAHRQE